MTQQFGIIRHAPTRWNLEKRFQGTQDIPLCPYGKTLALEWAGQLSCLGFEKIVTSPMKRALETGRIIGRQLNLEVVPTPGLQEQNFGEWEGKTLAGIRAAHPGEPQCQERRGWSFTPANGESRSQVLARALATVDKLPSQKLLIITHNSVIKALVNHGLGLDFMPGRTPEIKFGHLHWITRDLTRIVPNALVLGQERAK